MKAAHTPNYLLLAILTVLMTAFAGCASVEKLIDKGEYDKAMEVATRKIAGKDRKNPRYVRALENAFNRVTDQELAEAERLTRRSQPDWPRIHVLYDRISRRQEALRPLLPVVDENGREAQFFFAEVDEVWDETRQNATDQLYDEATVLLERGRAGDRSAAREAYDRFADVEDFAADCRDVRQRQREAEELGTIHVLVEMENRSGAWLSWRFDRELERLERRDLDTRWRKFDFEPIANRDYHYAAQIVLREVRVSPEREQIERFTEQRIITDGTEPVRDASGRIVIDSLTGRQLTQPRRITVTAEVLAYQLSKQATLGASLEIYDADGRLVDSDDRTTQADFQDLYYDFRGDRRALSTEVRNNLDNARPDFPDDEDMLADAAAELIPQLQRRLTQSDAML